MKSFSKLTVGEYQQLYQIHRSDDNEIDKTILSIALLTGKTRWEVEDMNMDLFRDHAKRITVLFSALFEEKPRSTLKVSGKKYAVCLNPRKLTAGQYVDLQHFLDKGGIIENLHKLMACLLTRKRLFGKSKYDGANHESISEGIQDCNFMAVHSTCTFFLRLWNLSIKATAPYLTKEFLKKTNSPLSKTDLQNIMDGFLTPQA